jgi:hypothetical protein
MKREIRCIKTALGHKCEIMNWIRVFENRVLKRTFGPKVEKGSGWRLEKRSCEDLGIDAKQIFERILNKQGGKAWTGFSWHRIGYRGGLL